MAFRLASVLFVVAVTASAAFAQEDTAETLPQAIAQAIATSPTLASARDQAQAARQALPIAWSQALPQIAVNASANHIYRSEPTLGFFVRDQSEYWIASVNTSWLLFGSGRILSSTHNARAQIARAAAEYQNARQQLLTDVSRAYAGVILARAVKDAQERALANLGEQLNYVDANVSHGFLTQTDRAQSQARVEQARASLALANAQLVDATETFARLIGHVPGAVAAPSPMAGLPVELAAAQARGEVYNPTVLSAAARLDSADAALDQAKAEGRARLSLETNNSVFEAFESNNGKRESEDTVGLRLSVPVFSGGATYARTRQQRLLRSAATYDLDEARRRVHQQVSVAWANLEAARANVTASTARLEAADLAQRGMQREQRAGTRPVIDALNQEQELLSARVDLARAQRDVIVTEFEFAAAIGALATSIPEEAPKN